MNRAYRDRDQAGGSIRKYSDRSCNSCANILNDIDRLALGDLSVDGDRFRLQNSEASPISADGRILVDFRYSSDPYIEVDRAGGRRAVDPGSNDQDAQAVLRRQGAEWRLFGLRLVPA